MSVPANYKYTKTHEWISQGGNKVKVGITDYAQKELGDVVFISLPKVGETLKKEQSFSQVESVKAVSDIYAPVGGKVVAINETLSSAPEAINQDPFNKGWIIELEMTNNQEAQDLLTGADYDGLLAEISK